MTRPLRPTLSHLKMAPALWGKAPMPVRSLSPSQMRTELRDTEKLNKKQTMDTVLKTQSMEMIAMAETMQRMKAITMKQTMLTTYSMAPEPMRSHRDTHRARGGPRRHGGPPPSPAQTPATANLLCSHHRPCRQAVIRTKTVLLILQLCEQHCPRQIVSCGKPPSPRNLGPSRKPEPGSLWIDHLAPKVFPSKIVLKIKRGSDGTVGRYKARLVLLGHLQRAGIDYGDTYAPVADFTVVRALLAKTASSEWLVHQMGVKCAFLTGDLDEDLYMSLPPDYAHPKGLVCKLSAKNLRAKAGASRVEQEANVSPV